MAATPGDDDAGKDDVYHNLERQFIQLQQDHARSKKEGEELQARLTSSTEVSAQDKAKIAELQQALASREGAVAEHQRAAEGKEHEVRRLSELLARANKELDSSKEYLHVKEESLAKFEARLRQVTMEKTALETEVLPTQVDVERLRRELEACKSRLSDTEGELNIKLEELNEERKRASGLRLDLESKLNRAEAKATEAQERVRALESQLRSKDAALDHKEEEMLAQVKRLSEVESRFDAELVAQRRVARLQEEQRKEAEASRDALLQEVRSLKGAYEGQLQQQKERLQTQREKYEKVVEDLEKSQQEQVAHLEGELRAEREAHAALQRQAASATARAPPTAAAQAMASFAQDLNLTERLNKVAELETALHNERSEKERFKFFAQQLTKEIGEKAPILAKERREKDLIAKSYDKVVAQLDRVTKTLVMTEKRLQGVGAEREELIEKVRGHDQLVLDLSRQVQLLLHERMSARAAEAGMDRAITASQQQQQQQQQHQQRLALPPSTTTTTSMDESLVTFRDIQELQTRNTELLAVVRKLTDEKAAQQADSSRALVSVGVQQELGKAHQELKRLGEDREAMQAAVATIASERDMYRLLLIKAESKLLTAGESSPSAASQQQQLQQTPATAEAKSAGPGRGGGSGGQGAREVELESKLRNAMDRLGRLEELYNEQVKVADGLRADMSAARQDATLSKADASFFQERYKRLQEDQEKGRQDELASMNEVHALRAQQHALEKAMSDRGHDLEAARDEARRFRVSLQQANVEKEVAVGAEKRLEQDLVYKRAEVERLTKVLETSQSLSASLTARTDAEREHLESERKLLQGQVAAARKELQEERAAAEARVTALGNEVRLANAKAEEDGKALMEVRAESLELKVQLNAANEKATSLARQLEGTQKRLDTLATSGTVTAIAVREASEKEAELERLTRELGEAKAKLAVVEGQRDTFKAASESHERQMRELQTRWEASEAEATATVSKAKAEVETLEKRLEEQSATTRSLVQENHALKEAQGQASEAAKKEHQEAMAQVDAAKKAADHAQGREQELVAEAKRASEAAESAKEQYRRELQLHAAAEAGMTELRNEMESMRTAKAEVDDRLTAVNAALLEKERAYAAERQDLAEASKKERQRADELQEQNKVVHAQLSVLADQLKKLHEDRMQGLEAAASGGAGAALEGDGGAASGAGEADKLRQAMIDLQGVAHYHRTQKELMEAGKEAAEMEAVRFKSTVQQLQKLLDQVRRELAEERKAHPTPESEREHTALLQQVQELSTLKDALAHLRQEKERLEKRLRGAEKEASDLRAAAGPAQQKEQQLEAERKALMAERDSLQQEVTSYSERLSTMVTRFHQIDPEVHRKLAADLEGMKTRIPALEGKLKEAEAKAAQAVREAEGKVAEHIRRIQEAEVKAAEFERRMQEAEAKNNKNSPLLQAARRQLGVYKQEAAAEKARFEGEVARLKVEVEAVRGEGGLSAAKLKSMEEESARLRISEAQARSEVLQVKQQLLQQQQQQQQALAEVRTAAAAAAASTTGAAAPIVPGAPTAEASAAQKEDLTKLQAELETAKKNVQALKDAGMKVLHQVKKTGRQ